MLDIVIKPFPHPLVVEDGGFAIWNLSVFAGGNQIGGLHSTHHCTYDAMG